MTISSLKKLVKLLLLAALPFYLVMTYTIWFFVSEHTWVAKVESTSGPTHYTIVTQCLDFAFKHTSVAGSIVKKSRTIPLRPMSFHGNNRVFLASGKMPPDFKGGGETHAQIGELRTITPLALSETTPFFIFLGDMDYMKKNTTDQLGTVRLIYWPPFPYISRAKIVASFKSTNSTDIEPQVVFRISKNSSRDERCTTD